MAAECRRLWQGAALLEKKRKRKDKEMNNVTNSWTGIGNIGADLELRSTASGKSVTSFNMACDRRRKDVDGNTIKDVDWIPVTVWGTQAESCAKHLKKGRRIAVTGRLQFRSYKVDEVTHRTAEIVADTIKFL